MDWSSRSIELVWAASLAAVPVALLAAACSRLKWLRPATRHALWFAVLATLLSPVLIGLGRPAWFQSRRVLAAADQAADAVIRSATSAKSAPLALAPLDRHPVSTLDDLPDDSAPPPNFRHAPTLDSARANAASAATPLAITPRPRDTQPAIIEPAPGAHPASSLTSTPTLRSPATPFFEAPTTNVVSTPPRPIAAAKPAPEVATLPATPESTTASPSHRTGNETIASSAPTHPASPSIFTQVRDWLGHVLAVRDALAAVPAIPPLVWLGGAALVALVWAFRIAQVRRMLRRAEPAPAPLLALVRRLSRVAGLKHAPETLVVNDRISPMIWCGLRPRLVIPRELWGELDSRCQCAVIMHELSHLRRRDHLLCLLQSVIGLVYWWHPIAWWARARLRDEAEACCDAWVTTLLPGGRRAYAEALVATKSFLSLPGRSGAPGLSVVSGRTRQLARRISMVMTQRVAPKASFLGLAFALSVGAAGVFVMPGLACPPEDEKPSGQATKVVGKENTAKLKAEKTVRAKLAAKETDPLAQRPDVAPQAFFGEAPALEAMRAGQAQQPSQPGHMNQLQDMERSLQQMERRLQEMQRNLESMHKPRSQGGGASSSPFTAVSPAAPRSVTGTQNLRGLTTTSPRVFTAPRIAVAPRAATTIEVAPDSGAVEGRSYNLPKGKLDALVALMARDDVPIYVSWDGDSITVNATPQQHRNFQAFINMINPGPRGGANNLLEQQLHERALHDHAIAAEHAAQAHALAAHNLHAHRDALRVQAEQLRSQARTLEAQKSSTQRQAEGVRRQIERAKQQAEKAREKARKSNDEAEADRVEEALDREIEALESQIDSIDSSCEAIDCQIESIHDAIDSLTKAAADADDAQASAPAQPAVSVGAPTTAMPAIAPIPPAVAAPASMPSIPAPPATPAPAAAPSSPASSTPAAPAMPPAPMTTAGAAPTPAPAAPSAR